jgi:prepilin-type N-terminal cleavage/methylation domain-containing protein
MRRGVTLLELVFVLAIVGMLVGVVAPGAAYFADRVAVEHQATRILSAYRSAWLTARTQQRLTLLRITADTLAIRTVLSAGAADTTLIWMSTGPAGAGVALTSPAHTTVFAPDGVAMGLSNTSHRLQKGGARRQVVVSRLGRVRITP